METTIKTNQSLRVLTVDDSPIVSESIGALLGELSSVNWVGHAFNLSEAHIQIIEHKPQVIILDINMKEESGFDLLQFLTEKHPEIEVMMLTNLAYAPYRKKSFELGAKYFLDKSSEFEKIPEILNQLLKTK